MDQGELDQVWQKVFEGVSEELQRWREEHPTATFKQIEEETDARLSGLRSQMLADLAQKSQKREWSGQAEEERPKCPQCGTALVARGKHKRRLATQGDQSVELAREYGSCPKCGGGFFPPG
jgi:ribosomal protein S27AE